MVETYSTNNKKKKKQNNILLLRGTDLLEKAQNLMWENHNNKKDPFKRTIILQKIIALQTYIWTAYYKTRSDRYQTSRQM
jgi:hypothetical protein